MKKYVAAALFVAFALGIFGNGKGNEERFSIDYILITDAPGGTEIPNLTVPVNFSLVGFASAYNNSIGYIGTVIVNWSVENFDANASTLPPINDFSTFNSGFRSGYATWWAEDGYGHADKVSFRIDGPPVTKLLIGEPHYVKDDAWWVTDTTPFILIAIDNTSHYLYGNESDSNVSTFYSIDNEPWQLYTEPFNLSGRTPGQHMIKYYSVDEYGNEEPIQYAYEIFLDYTPPELIDGGVEPSVGNESDVFAYNVTYIEDTGRVIDHFHPPGNVTIAFQDDMHVRKAVGYDNNTHIVWMSNRLGHWEIYYKEINPRGTAYKKIKEDGSSTWVVIDQTIVPETMISDNNASDSVLPSLVIEPHKEVYLNDTIYKNRYALLAAPVRYYYDQTQLIENNSCWLNGTLRWQEFVAGKNYKKWDLWIDIMIYKDKNLTYNGNITLLVRDLTTNNIVFIKTIPSNMIPNGKQWLAFYNFTISKIAKGFPYRIEVITNDPYKWYYVSKNLYSKLDKFGVTRGKSSLDGATQKNDFTFIVRYEYPEIRFKYELSKMRKFLLTQGFNDTNIHFLTIPYWIFDGLGNKVKWRIPWSDNYPKVEWQPLPFNFTESWIDGNATYNEFKNALQSIQENSSQNDIVVIYLQDHGGSTRPNGNCHRLCAVGIPKDPRVKNDEIEDGRDESFGTYASPTDANVANMNSWYDDELDIELDKINYKDMVIIIDACHSGGFIPDCSGRHRIVCSSGREDETTYSYVYRIYDRFQNKSADVDGNGWISVEEAHAFAVKQIKAEHNRMIQHPQINVDESIHVVWVDKRDDNDPTDTNDIWEIYYSKLGGIVNYSSSNNGVDLTSPDWRVSANDGFSSGRVVAFVDSGTAQFIEHPGIAIDSKHNISIVWSDFRNSSTEQQWEIYYQLQDNASGGVPTTLIDDTRISNEHFIESDSISPAIDVGKDNMVYIVWQDRKSGAWEIFFEKLNPYIDDCDGNSAVDSQIAIINHDDLMVSSNDGFDSASPDIAVDDDGVAHVVFMDKRQQDPGHEGEGTHIPNNWEVYTLTIKDITVAGFPQPIVMNEKRQSDMSNPGTSYGNYAGGNDGHSMYPRVEVSNGWANGDTFITWHDNRNGNWEIYYTEVANSCSNPAADIRVTKNASSDMYPDIALNGQNNPNIKWQTNRYGNWDILNVDWNDLNSIKINIDGFAHHLLPFNSSDDNAMDGITYIYGTSLQPGLHNFSFYANSGIYEVNTSLSFAPFVYDTTPPQIFNVEANPSHQVINGYVNITCNVSDNVGIDEVRINITYPDNSFINVTMNEGYYYNNTYSMIGTYYYYIWAKDTSENTNISAIYQFEISEPSIDYIVVTFETENEIMDYNISTNISFIAYASAFNYTYGFIEFVNANWSLVNYGSNASINASYGKSIEFNSGWKNGIAILYAENGTYNDSVILNINSSLFTFLLKQGWNFITLPCINDYYTSTLFQNISGCKIILIWNTSSGNFDIYVPGCPYDYDIEDGKGYFVAVEYSTFFALEDLPIESITIHLYIGWNTIGWFNSTPILASSLYNEIVGSIILLKWNATSQEFMLYIPQAPDFYIYRGEGILIAVNEESDWHGS